MPGSRSFGKEFQEHIAAVLCRAPLATARLSSIIDPDSFDNEDVAAVVNTVAQHYRDTHDLLSKQSIIENLKETNPDVNSLLEKLWEHDIRDEAHVVDTTVDFAKQRALEAAILESADIISEDGPTDGIVKLIQDALLVGDDIHNIGSFVQADLDERAMRYIRPETVYRIPTGLRHIDVAMNGGVLPATLNCFLGPPGSGKSFCLANVGFNAAKGHAGCNVIHYTLEMTTPEVLERYDSLAAGSKVNILRTDNPNRFVDKLKVRQSRLMSGDVLIKGYPTRSASVEDIRAHALMLRSYGFNPDMIVVDYADIIKAVRRLDESWHAQAGIYEDLRGLAGELSIPIWTASQGNRSSMDKEVLTIADIAESFEKAAVVDSLIGICRTLEEKDKGLGRFVLSKYRGGRDSQIIDAVFDLSNARITTTCIRGVFAGDNTGSKKKSTKKKKSRSDMSPEEKEEADEEKEPAVMRKMGKGKKKSTNKGKSR